MMKGNCRGFMMRFMTLAIMAIAFMVLGSQVEAAEYDSLPVPTKINAYLDEWGDTHVTFEAPESKYDNDSRLQFMLQCDEDDDWSDNGSYSEIGRDGGYLYLDAGETYYFRMQTWLVEGDTILDESEWSDTFKIKITYAPVENVKVTTLGLEKLKITWKKSEAPTGYKIYRAEEKDGTYKLVKTVKDYDITSWTDTGLTTGKKYYYKIRMYGDYFEDGTLYGKYSKIVSGTPKPPKKILTAKPASATSVRLIWSASGKAITGYQIYRSTSKDSGYKRIRTIKDPSTTSYVNKDLTNGETYYYKMRAYAVVDGENVYGDYSAVKTVKVTRGVPEIKSISLDGPTKVTINYYKVADADGYQIYQSTEKDSGYKRVKTIKDIDTLSKAITGLTLGETYYFKVRSYNEVDGEKKYSAYSEVHKCLMNKVGYANETYQQKAQRIFGKDYYVDFKSAKAAEKQMKEIKVKTWDINSNGKKYTRYHYLTVHKNIAGTVQQIFKEIYNGDEKFPIKDVGGYSWRGDNSSSQHCEGLAVDINYNENAQFNGETGKPMTGELYKPGKNPYSIPPDGDVVHAFEKYGFIWGDWFSNPDYMHFSYFGG